MKSLRKNRCWKGYKPVKGKRAYSKGSCRRVLRRNAYSAVATPKSLAKFFAFQKDGNTESYTAFLPKAEEYFARGEGQEAQRLMLRFMRLERGNDVDLRRLQGNPKGFAVVTYVNGEQTGISQSFSTKEQAQMMVDRGWLATKLNKPNTTMRMAQKARLTSYEILPLSKIPNRTARAMLRAGLPLERSDLRGNPSKYVTKYKSDWKILGFDTAPTSHDWLMRINFVKNRGPGKILMDYLIQGYKDAVWYETNGLKGKTPAQADALLAPIRGLRINARKGSGYLDMGHKEQIAGKRGRGRGYDGYDGRPDSVPMTRADRYRQGRVQIVAALKALKARNHNDEMIESVVTKPRPGKPRDAIVIVKYRYYVNGSRVYSAGLKSEGTISNFAQIFGRKIKRIGNSDYVFGIYGIRFPEDFPHDIRFRSLSKPGKLFPNNGSSDEIPLEAKIYGVFNGKKLDTPYRAVLVTKSRDGNLIRIQQMIKGSWSDVNSGYKLSTLLYQPSNTLSISATPGWGVVGMMRALGEAMIRVNYDGSKR